MTFSQEVSEIVPSLKTFFQDIFEILCLQESDLAMKGDKQPVNRTPLAMAAVCYLSSFYLT